MYDEPYRWVEAIRNRHEYLEDQLSAGSAIIALPFQSGALLATLGTGTSKLYEIYDQIAFGGMGHPADLEKLRNVALDIAHVEGFNHSPADVTVRRLLRFGLAPMVKQAFEEVLHAPYIARIVMAEISIPSGKQLFFRLNYDGVFEEREDHLVLGSKPAITQQMEAFLVKTGDTSSLSWGEALKVALRAWAICQLPLSPEPEKPAEKKFESLPTNKEIDAVLKTSLQDRTIEVALLDRTQPGSSKYRALSQEEIQTVLKGWLK